MTKPKTADYEIAIPPQNRGAVELERLRKLWPGDCYARASTEMLRSQDNASMRLVHAEVPNTVKNDGTWCGHAWCEVSATFIGVDDAGNEVELEGTAVIDTAQPDPNAHMLPAEWYYAYMAPGPRNVKRYTLAEMIANAMRYRNDGPWQ